MLQWEDFSTVHARPILEVYRDRFLTFNDDIQGTAAVALGVILGAIRVTGREPRDSQLVMLGAGSAGIGVADYLRHAMVAGGLTDSEARSRFWIVDKDGLLHSGRTDLSAEQRAYAQDVCRIADWPATSAGKVGLADVIGKIDATILIGLSTVAGAFTESIVKEMARKTPRPIILPLSNPTSRSEAKAEDLIHWTQGRALVATGSPSAPVSFEGRRITVAQCNNVYVFPAVGLGVVASRAQRVSDGMLLAAGRALGELSPALRDPFAPLLPALTDIREVTAAVAVEAGLQAQKEGLAPQTSEDELRRGVAAHQWKPAYAPIAAHQ